MATYKVIQDIEAEDKLLGPLTLRQFIYAAIVILMGFVAFKLAALSLLLIIPFILPMGFFGLLAAPFGHDQSSEVWLLAKIRFMLKPRLRKWDQTGMQELVTITAPKVVEQNLTDGLSQTEVKSRLQALANTIDSRGWAVKNVNVNLATHPSYATSISSGSDRLVDATSLPQAVSNLDVRATDDMMDIKNNPTAQHLTTMISQSTQAHRQSIIDNVQGRATAPTQPADYWFMNQPDPAKIPQGMTAFSGSPTILPGTQMSNPVSDKGAAEQALLNKLHVEQSKPKPGWKNMKKLDPKGNILDEYKHKSEAKQHKSTPPVTSIPQQPNPAITRLSTNDDLNISTIAREANKAVPKATTSEDGEVTISLR